mgnify:CR=1 FL=1
MECVFRFAWAEAIETMGSMRQLVEKDFRSEDTPRLAKNLLGQVLALEIDGDLDSKKLNDWFSVLLQTEGPNIFRMKGILSVKDSEERMVFQGVHMLFDSQPGEPWGSEPRHNRLVFIGRELNEDYLQETLKLCLA